MLAHPELFTLGVAHLDADAFYAAIEKRDRPELRDKPVIVGGGRRGVVATCCYLARLSGVRSAMPMFKALALCPRAEVVRPRMDVYVAESRRIRAMMETLTPLVAPLSLDEATMDLRGCERLHRAPPAAVLARLQAAVEAEIGVSVSIGLSHNRFLAKLASEQDKPRGFAVIGEAETLDRLADLPVRALPGVGPGFAATLAREGVAQVRDLRRIGRDALAKAHGAGGMRLWRLAHGRDSRSVEPDRAAKSVSSETTFDADLGDAALLEAHLWRLSLTLSDRLKAKDLAGKVLTLKLKRADFRSLTRRRTLAAPTDLADRIFREGRALLRDSLGDAPFRLIGVGLSDFTAPAQDSDLLDPDSEARARAERAMDAIRQRFGDAAISLGRGARRR